MSNASKLTAEQAVEQLRRGKHLFAENIAENIAQDVADNIASGIGETVSFRGELSVWVAASHLVAVCEYLKTACGFNMLTDLSGVDNFGESPRYEVDYLLYALTHRCHLRLKVAVDDASMTVPSVVSVWRTADWHEREAFDMFGLRFAGHPNLTRILMWEGYPHHPLRKDFPLAGLPTDLPSTAENAGKVEAAPMAGGPFVPGTGTARTVDREPRASRGGFS